MAGSITDRDSQEDILCGLKLKCSPEIKNGFTTVSDHDSNDITCKIEKAPVLFESAKTECDSNINHNSALNGVIYDSKKILDISKIDSAVDQNMICTDEVSSEPPSSFTKNHNSYASHKATLLTPEYSTPPSDIAHSNEQKSDLAAINFDTCSASVVKSGTELSIRGENAAGLSMNVLNDFESATTFTESLKEGQSASCTESNLLKKFHDAGNVCESSNEQSATNLSLNSLNESQSEITSHEHSQETPSELKSEIDTESVPKQLSVNNDTQNCLVEEHNNDCASIDATETEDVEDMQSEECQITAKVEDCCIISETEMEMDSSVTGSVAAQDESNDVRFNEKVDDIAAPVESSDMANILDSCNVGDDDCVESAEAENHCLSEEQDVAVDEGVPDDSPCASIEPDVIEADSCEIRIIESRSIAEDFVSGIVVTDTDHMDRDKESKENSNNLENRDNESEENSKNFENIAMDFESGNDFTSVLDNNSPKTGLLEHAHNSEAVTESECAIEGDSENLDDKMSQETDSKSEKVELNSDTSQQDLNTYMTGFVSEGKGCVNGPVCQVNDAAGEVAQTGQDDSCIGVLDKSVEETILTVQGNMSEINETCVTECDIVKVNNEQNGLHLPIIFSVDHKLDSSVFIDGVNSIDEKENLNNLHEMEEADLGIKTEKLDNMVNKMEEKQELVCGQVKAAVRTEEVNDDDILFVDEAGENKPSECSVQMPKSATEEKVTSVSEEDSIAVERDSGQDQELTIKRNEEKAVNQIFEISDEKLDVSSNGFVQKNDSSAGSGRKRTQEEDTSTVSKRSRLDTTMDKLEDEKSTEAASEVLDSEDDDVILTKEASEIKSIAEETIMPTDTSPIVLTSEALKSLIELRVKAFLKSYKQASLDRLNLRAKGMQSASSLWKETAKHLEKSVAELTVLNQKLEKRRIYCNSIKQQDNKSIGIQVNEALRNSLGPHINSPSNKRPETSSNVIHYLPQPSQSQRVDIRHQRGSYSTIQNPGFATQSPVHGTHIRPGHSAPFQGSSNTPASTLRPALTPQGRIPQSQGIRPPVAARSVNNVVNLIDLTDDDDYSRKTSTQIPKYTPPQQRTNNISKLAMGGRMAASDNRNIQFSSPVHRSNIPLGSNNQILQRSASGFQQFNSHNPRTGLASNSQYQPVNMNNSLSPRSSGFQTFDPSPRARFPNNIHISGQPNINRRALQQNSAQNTTVTTKPVPHSLPPSFHISSKHPAPLPTGMDTGNAPPTAKKRPPKPGLKISRVSQGIVLSWNMPPLNDVEKISSYQLFAYQESDSTIPKSSLWKKVGDVKALPLPMACTLTQFQEGNKYHFAVRAVDQYGRWGAYSDPNSIFLSPKT